MVNFCFHFLFGLLLWLCSELVGCVGWQIWLLVRASAATVDIAVAVRTAGWLSETVCVPFLSLCLSLSCACKAYPAHSSCCSCAVFFVLDFYLFFVCLEHAKRFAKYTGRRAGPRLAVYLLWVCLWICLFVCCCNLLPRFVTREGKRGLREANRYPAPALFLFSAVQQLLTEGNMIGWGVEWDRVGYDCCCCGVVFVCSLFYVYFGPSRFIRAVACSVSPRLSFFFRWNSPYERSEYKRCFKTVIWVFRLCFPHNHRAYPFFKFTPTLPPKMYRRRGARRFIVAFERSDGHYRRHHRRRRSLF